MLIPRVALVLSGLLLALHGLYTNVGRFTLQWQDSAGSAQWQFWGLRRRQFFEPSALSKLTCVPIYHDIYAISIAVRGGGDLRFGAQLSSASRAWLMDQLEKAIAAHRAGSQS